MTSLSANKLFVVFLLVSSSLAADEPLDTDFLEWLGQTAGVEEFGIDLDKLFKEKEKLNLQEEIEDNES